MDSYIQHENELQLNRKEEYINPIKDIKNWNELLKLLYPWQIIRKGKN